MILVDTSIWIAVFSAEALDLESEVDFDSVVTIGPVVQEVLQGFRHERAFRHAHDAMLALPRLMDPLDMSVFADAAGLYRAARRQGLTPRSTLDCVIAAAAIREDALVLHRDRDFPLLAQASSLRERNLPPATA